MNDRRTIVAFLVAPLAAPLLAILQLLEIRPPADELGIAIASTTLSYALFSYIGTVLLGIPVYRFLCARNLTAFWMAPAVGLLAGAAVLVILSLSFNLIADITVLTGVVLAGGIYGAPVGVLLWLIARTDRNIPASSAPSN
jgi:hypothetical protein